MRTLVGLALIAKIITTGFRLAGALLIAPFRAAALVAPGPVGVMARRALMGVGGGAAIVALLLARVRAAGGDHVPPGVTDGVDAFVAAGRRAIAHDLAGPRPISRHVLPRGNQGTSPRGDGQIVPRDTSLAALLAAAQEAAARDRVRRVATHMGGGR